MEIKDYLHLYLGCNGEIRHGEVVKLTTQILHQSLNPKSGVDFKPILRKLDSMTEAEAKELDWVYPFSKETQADLINNLMPWEVLFFLKHHFDLFGLIDAGLAIDAKTLKRMKKEEAGKEPGDNFGHHSEIKYCAGCGIGWDKEEGSDQFGCWSCGFTFSQPASKALEEIERLKGLIEKAYKAGRNDFSYEEWKRFKRNNLL